MNEYKQPRLTIDRWRVTHSDLYNIYQFFTKRFKKLEIEIHLETSSGNNAVYVDFNKFDRDIRKIIKAEGSVTAILFSAGHIWKDDINKQKHVWIDIHFDHGDAEFYMYTKDNDGSLLNWSTQAYESLSNLHSVFSSKGVDVASTYLDYLGSGEPPRVNLYTTPITDMAFVKGRGWYKNPIQFFSLFIGVAGVTVSLTSLVIQLILSKI